LKCLSVLPPAALVCSRFSPAQAYPASAACRSDELRPPVGLVGHVVVVERRTRSESARPIGERPLCPRRSFHIPKLLSQMTADLGTRPSPPPPAPRMRRPLARAGVATTGEMARTPTTILHTPGAASRSAPLSGGDACAEAWQYAASVSSAEPQASAVPGSPVSLRPHSEQNAASGSGGDRGSGRREPGCAGAPRRRAPAGLPERGPPAPRSPPAAPPMRRRVLPVQCVVVASESLPVARSNSISRNACSATARGLRSSSASSASPPLPPPGAASRQFRGEDRLQDEPHRRGGEQHADDEFDHCVTSR